MLNLFADADAQSSIAMWTAISAIFIALINAIPTWIDRWKGNTPHNIKKQLDATNKAVHENTELTVQTKREINGKMTEYVEEVRKAAHAEGMKAGLLEAKQIRKP